VAVLQKQPTTGYAESLSGLIERVTFFNEENGPIGSFSKLTTQNPVNIGRKHYYLMKPHLTLGRKEAINPLCVLGITRKFRHRTRT
jgi:hypothetical protein